MFKRCLMVVLMLAGVGCAWGQWTVNKATPSIDYDELWWICTGGRKINLSGGVYVAKASEKADFKVRIVKGKADWADLEIAITDRKPTFKGQWRFVSSRDEANFSIQFVDRDEHFSVRFISMSEWEQWNTNCMGIPVIWHEE